MSRCKCHLDELVTGVFTHLTRFLTGVDLLRLSHVNQRLLTELLAPDDPEWQWREPQALAATDSPVKTTAKEQYFLSRSIRFAGNAVGERGSAIELWRDGMPPYWHYDSFSLDLWFALLPVDVDSIAATGVRFGGVLLGAQSVAWSHGWWAERPEQFIMVDTHSTLYCSVTDTKIAVATNLQSQRWYHLALTFDRAASEPALPTQRVYLDGALVHTATGTLHSEAYSLRYGQLGSGCVRGLEQYNPTDEWYGFHGILDSARLWCGVLQPEHVRRASQRKPPLHTGERMPEELWYIDASEVCLVGGATWVQCTRPLERVCTVISSTGEGQSPAL